MSLPEGSVGPEKKQLIVIVFAAIAPVAAAFYLILHYAVNIPYIDDYPNFLGFALQLRLLPTFSSRFIYFLSVQHDEYKFVFMHIVALIELGLTHKVDMRVLSVVGDLFLLALLPLLWKIYVPKHYKLESKLLFFLPIIFLVFGLNYAEGVTWPSSTLFYVPAIFFSYLAIHLLVTESDSCEWVLFLWGCCSALLAYLTAPNAAALLPIGLVLLAFRRAFVRGVIWCLVFVCGLVPYLVTYQTKNGQVVALGHASLLAYFSFFLSFVGSIALKAPMSLAAGIVILVVLGFAIRTEFARTHLSATLGIVWMLAGASLVAYGRAHAGVSFALTPRYRIYSDLFAVYCYGACMSWIAKSSLTLLRQRLLRGAVFGLALIHCVINDLHAVSIMKVHRAQLMTGLAQYQAAPDRMSPMYFLDETTEQFFVRQEVEARILMNGAAAQGLYVPPQAPLLKMEP